jgi:hypothetical protein
VSAQVSASDLKLAPTSPICASTFSRSLVDLASLSKRVTIKVSPDPSAFNALASEAVSLRAGLFLREHSLCASSLQSRLLCLKALPVSAHPRVSDQHGVTFLDVSCGQRKPLQAKAYADVHLF